MQSIITIWEAREIRQPRSRTRIRAGCHRDPGFLGSAGAAFVNEVGRRITAANGEQRATSFLKQRLSMAVQRGNAAAVLGTFVASDPSSED